MARLLKNTAKAWRIAACLSLLAGTAIYAPSVRAQQDDQSARLDRIENEIQTLSRAVFKGEQPPAGTAAQMQAGGTSGAADEERLTEIENELRALTGKVEQHENTLQQLQKQIGEMQGRTVAPVATETHPAPAGNSGDGFDAELYGNAPATGAANNAGAPVATTPPLNMANPNAAAPPNAPTAGKLGQLEQNTVNGTVQASPTDPVNQYQQAFNDLRDRKYEEAQKGFELFLAANPDSNLAPNAQYWLGESFYARNNFERAARVFAESYQKYPKGPKGPDSLLKLAMALAGMGKKDDACLSISQLRQEYSAGAGAVLARAEQESQSLGCH
ncbi:MAG TPA: tol-pal system protein YbgF [Patescibacteria group bacterium]|nr:tol-pal system protein YbgF [Patescibacteria group bacterium]